MSLKFKDRVYGTIDSIAYISVPANRVVNVFIFFKNDRFVMKTTTKIEKRNDRF